MDQQEPRALDDAAERREDEAACLGMLADADEQAPQTAGIAGWARAVSQELRMEAEYLRRKAAKPP